MLALLLWAVAGPAAAFEIQHVPIERAAEGEAVLIQAAAVSTRPVVSAYLFVRPAGKGVYVPLPMSVSGNQLSAELPGDRLTAAGLDYYIEVQDDQGNRATFPAVNAPSAPIRLSVEPSSGRFEILPVYPRPREIVAEVRPVLRVRFTRAEGGADPNTVRVFLDHIDRTAEVRFEENEFTLPTLLGSGTHYLNVGAKSRTGTLAVPLTTSFVVRMSTEPRVLDMHGRAEAETAFVFLPQAPGSQRFLAIPKTESGFAPSFRFESSGKVGEARLRTQVSHNPFDRGEQPDKNRYTATFDGKKWKATLGDGSSQLTELTAYYTRLRGLDLEFRPGRAKLKAFAGQSKRALFDSRFNSGTYAQRVYGARVQLARTGRLSVGAAFVQGRDDPASLPAGVATLAAESQAGGADVELRLPLGLALSGELARNRYQPDLKSTAAVWGTAWQAEFAQRLSGGNWEARYRRVDPGYVSLVNPFLRNDSASVDARGETRVLSERLKLTGGLGSSRNNVDGSKASTLRSRNVNAGLGWTPAPDKPTYTLNAALSASKSEPPEDFALDNRSLSYAAGWDHRMGAASYGVRATLTQYRDRAQIPLSNDTDSYGLSGSTGFIWRKARVQGQALLNHVRDLFNGNKTYFASLGGGASKLLSPSLRADFRLGLARSWNDSLSQNAYQTSYGLVLTRESEDYDGRLSVDGVDSRDAAFASNSYHEIRFGLTCGYKF